MSEVIFKTGDKVTFNYTPVTHYGVYIRDSFDISSDMDFVGTVYLEGEVDPHGFVCIEDCVYFSSESEFDVVTFLKNCSNIKLVN